MSKKVVVLNGKPMEIALEGDCICINSNLLKYIPSGIEPYSNSFIIWLERILT